MNTQEAKVQKLTLDIIKADLWRLAEGFKNRAEVKSTTALQIVHNESYKHCLQQELIDRLKEVQLDV